MASTFGGLNTMVRGLYAQQMGLNTVGHNIASADKDGYSRQQVNLQSSVPEEIYGGHGSLQLGTGVLVNSINRLRDTFVDRQMWKESATLGYGQSLHDSLSKIQEIFQEPSTENGLQGVLNKFWSAWQTLGKDPSIASGGRATVIQRGQELVDTITTAGQKFYDQISDLNSVIDIKVNKVNEITSEIFSLNKQIASIEMGNKGQANDLRDTRDNLVDQLSGMVKVTVNEDQYGHYNIQAGGVALVTGTDVTKLTTQPSTMDDKYGYEVKNVMVQGSNKIMDLGSGEIKALIDVRDSEDHGLKGYLNKLDNMSQFLLTDFNAVHKSGYDVETPVSKPGDNFFGDSGVDYYNSPDSYGNISDKVPTGMQGTWLSNLKLNPELLKQNGDAKVAAKTMAAVTQSNIKGGPALLSGTYTGAALPEKNFTVAITGIDAKGNVTGASYSTDNGVTWNNALPDAFSLDGGGSIQIPASTPVGSTYTTTVRGQSYTIRVDALDGSGTVTAASYSTVPAATWKSALPDTFSLSDGVKIRIAGDQQNVVSSPPTTINDTYKFTMPAQNNASGDNAYRLAQIMKADVRQVLGDGYNSRFPTDVSLDSFYNSVIGTVGVQTQNAERLSDNQQTMVNQITNWREATSGVNLDEELTNMIRFQKGYSSAARVINAMDEMLDKLINGTGVVGR